MDKKAKKRYRHNDISSLTRVGLELAYMSLYEISLQKTELIKDLKLEIKDMREEK